MTAAAWLEELQASLARADRPERDRQWVGLRFGLEQMPAPERQTCGQALHAALEPAPPGGGTGAWPALAALFLGHIEGLAFAHQAAMACYDQGRTLAAAAAADLAAHLDCRCALARLHSLSELGGNLQARSEAEALAKPVARLGLVGLAAETDYVRGLIERRLGRSQDARKHLAASLESFQQAGSELFVGRAEDALGLVCLDLGELDQAELLFLRSLARQTRLDDQPGLALTLGNLGRFYALREESELAAGYLERELAICQKRGLTKASMVALRGLARLAIAAQAWKKADGYLRQVEALAGPAGEPISRAYAALTRGDYHLARGQWQAAELSHQAAAAEFGGQAGALVEALLTLQAARVHAGLGRALRAGDEFARAHQAFAGLGRPVFLARAEFAWALWLVEQGRLDDAAWQLERALTHADNLQAKRMVARFSAVCPQIGVEHWLKALRRSQRAAEALAAEQDRFAKLAEQMIHDLKNKVLTLCWGLKKVQANAAQGESIARHLALTSGMAQYMEELLMSYLVGTKLEGQRLDAAPQPLMIAPIFAELERAFVLPLEEKRLGLQLDPGPAETAVLADLHPFRLTLFNLVDNAIKYTPKGRGDVRIEAIVQGDVVRLEVVDQGEGVPEELRERIFQKWGRVHTQEVSYSTGLGLYHTKIMVEAMGGQIGVDSQVGRGSIFWFTVPKASRN